MRLPLKTAMMKLKHRLFIVPTVAILAVGSFILYTGLFADVPDAMLHVKRIQSSGMHQWKQPKTGSAQRNQRASNYFAKSDFDPQVAPHLAMTRKDLDVSNYTSPEVLGRKPADASLLEYVLKDKNIRNSDSVSNIIRIAGLVEQFKGQSSQSVDKSKPHQAAPPAGETSIPLDLGATRRRLKQLEIEQIVQGNRKFELNKSEIDFLENIVAKMKKNDIKPKRAPPLNLYKGDRLPNWRQFHNHITQYELYGADDAAVDALLRQLARQMPTKLYQHEGGTQLKLVLTFANHGRALWKPRRFPRDRETLPDHFYFSDFERFNAEIGAFRLDRVLGFHWVPPTAGRLLNVTRDIEPLAAENLAKTFFFSPVGNACFHGKKKKVPTATLR